VLEIPAAESGQLFYTFADATAPAGSLTIESPNESSVDHNIALEGGGVDEVGEVVADGGVSEIQVDVETGEYQFYCSVEGHRDGGMEGTLTVE
jgi:plastocyanin